MAVGCSTSCAFQDKQIARGLRGPHAPVVMPAHSLLLPGAGVIEECLGIVAVISDKGREISTVP